MVGVEARWIPRPARQLELQAATQHASLHAHASCRATGTGAIVRRSAATCVFTLHVHMQLTSEPRVSTKSLS